MSTPNVARVICLAGFVGYTLYQQVTNRALGIRAAWPDCGHDPNIVGHRRRPKASAVDTMLLRPSQAPEATAEMLLRPVAGIGSNDGLLRAANSMDR